MAATAARHLLFLLLCAALAAGASAAVAVESGGYLAGLGLHQETGRDIYLGGIFLPQNSERPDSLGQLSGPRTMEYRIVARRTSIRSLLGGMLLQSEVATGSAPSSATSEFADRLLSGIQGSLYAGDSLEVRLSEGGTTRAVLNSQEIAAIDSQEVADYLLAGWVNENGASTSFRDALMAEEVNPALVALQKANLYSPQRQAEVTSWFEEEVEEEPEATAADETQATDGELLLLLEPHLDVNSPHAAANGLALNLNMDAGTAETNSVTDLDAVQLAALMPANALQETLQGSEVLSLGVQEYAQRLAEFQSEVISMVYRKIRYPQRAVRRNLQGRIELDITLRETGELVAVSIATSSGHKILDEAAVKAAESALADGALTDIDVVAKAEFGSELDLLTVPVPVLFKLMDE